LRLSALAFTLVLVVAALFGISHQKSNAQGSHCDLALVLAIDASSSVNSDEYALQMKGMAAALLDTEVREAILSLGGMYMAAFEWNGRMNQKMLFEWTQLNTEADVFGLADALARHERNSDNSPTALGSALGFAHRLFPQLPIPCFRQVIDVSGDGLNNEGIPPKKVLKLWDFSKITVNGLAINGSDPLHDSAHQDVMSYYRLNVLHGHGSFLVIAENFEAFEEAMKKKLLKEITPGVVGMLDQRSR
jgi:hypothetical protein